MKIHLVGVEFHPNGQTEGQTDGQAGMKLVVAFSSFAKALKNSSFTHFVEPDICFGIVEIFLLIIVVVSSFCLLSFLQM